jgi:hypothetical protein
MYDQVLDNFRKATESTMHLQQEMFKNWTQQWFQMPGMTANPAVGMADQVRGLQKQCTNAASDMLNKHRETLDTQYRAGIRTIDDAFRLGDAKDPDQFRRLAEELWKQSFDCLKTIVESQMRDFQGAAEKWFEVASKGVASTTAEVSKGFAAATSEVSKEIAAATPKK